MARSRNPVETIQITLSTTPLMKSFLETLVEHGTFGKNAAEAAERLVAAKVSELREGQGDVAASLNGTWRRFQEIRSGHAK